MKAQLLPLLLVALLPACSGPIETRINSIGQAGLEPASFAIESTGGQPSADLALAQKLVSEALAAKGYRAAENPRLNLEVTLSSRPAALAIGDGGAVPIAAAKPRRVFQSCADTEYRLGVILTHIADGTIAYRSNAAEYHCKATLAASVPFLVQAAMADLGAPQGPRIIKRAGLE